MDQTDVTRDTTSRGEAEVKPNEIAASVNPVGNADTRKATLSGGERAGDPGDRVRRVLDTVNPHSIHPKF